MRRTPWSRLLVVAGVVAAVVYGGLRLAERQGAVLLPVPPLAPLVVLLIAAVVLVLGWNVRQYVRGKRPGLDMLLAARTVVLATAAGYTGALLTGWYVAHVLVTVGDWHVVARRDVAVAAAIAAVTTVALSVVGLVVERWCEVPGGDGDDDGGVAGSAGAAPEGAA